MQMLHSKGRPASGMKLKDDVNEQKQLAMDNSQLAMAMGGRSKDSLTLVVAGKMKA